MEMVDGVTTTILLIILGSVFTIWYKLGKLEGKVNLILSRLSMGCGEDEQDV